MVTPHARFSGSGRDFAMSCWEENQCAKLAVETAKKNDIFTGGIVKYVELNSAANNLSSDNETMQGLHKRLTNEGLVMNTRIGTVTPVHEHLQKKQITAALESDNVVASAPTGDINSPWNEIKEKNLDNAIDALRKLTDEV